VRGYCSAFLAAVQEPSRIRLVDISFRVLMACDVVSRMRTTLAMGARSSLDLLSAFRNENLCERADT
jgi:hypothetical protein